MKYSNKQYFTILAEITIFRNATAIIAMVKVLEKLDIILYAYSNSS